MRPSSRSWWTWPASRRVASHLSPSSTSHGRSRHGARGRTLQDPDTVALGAGMEHRRAFTFWRRPWAASMVETATAQAATAHREQRLLLGFPIATVPAKSRATSSLRREESTALGGRRQLPSEGTGNLAGGLGSVVRLLAARRALPCRLL
jgi:hypothetical protein